MPKSVKLARSVSRGLCTTCSNNPECTFPQRPGVPVMDCLEFRGETLKENTRRSPGASAAAQDTGQQHEPGLCPSCENRAACQFPKPVWGVWFCEEFV